MLNILWFLAKKLWAKYFDLGYLCYFANVFFLYLVNQYCKYVALVEIRKLMAMKQNSKQTTQRHSANHSDETEQRVNSL
jgi:hypothetical protein